MTVGTWNIVNRLIDEEVRPHLITVRNHTPI